MIKRAKSMLVYLLVLLLGGVSLQAFAADGNKLKIGIVVPAPPKFVFKVWQPVADHLNQTTGLDVEIKVIKGYDKIKEAIKNKDVDLFYVGAYIYYLLNEQNLVEPVAQVENLKGSIMTRSAVFVHTRSGVNSLQDLRAKKVAFVNPTSLGGYIAPRALLRKNGIAGDQDVQEIFTKNLSSSLHKTLLGDVAAGSMCSLKLKLMSRKIEIGDLKNIAYTDEYPENLIGARKGLSEQTMITVTEAFHALHATDAGQKVIKGMKPMKIKKFVPYDSRIIDVVRKLSKEAQI